MNGTVVKPFPIYSPRDSYSDHDQALQKALFLPSLPQSFTHLSQNASTSLSSAHELTPHSGHISSAEFTSGDLGAIDEDLARALSDEDAIMANPHHHHHSHLGRDGRQQQQHHHPQQHDPGPTFTRITHCEEDDKEYDEEDDEEEDDDDDDDEYDSDSDSDSNSSDWDQQTVASAVSVATTILPERKKTNRNENIQSYLIEFIGTPTPSPDIYGTAEAPRPFPSTHALDRNVQQNSSLSTMTTTGTSTGAEAGMMTRSNGSALDLTYDLYSLFYPFTNLQSLLFSQQHPFTEPDYKKIKEKSPFFTMLEDEEEEKAHTVMDTKMNWSDLASVDRIRDLVRKLLSSSNGIKEDEFYLMFSSPSPQEMIEQLRFGALSHLCDVHVDRFGRRAYHFKKTHQRQRSQIHFYDHSNIASSVFNQHDIVGLSDFVEDDLQSVMSAQSEAVSELINIHYHDNDTVLVAPDMADATTSTNTSEANQQAQPQLQFQNFAIHSFFTAQKTRLVHHANSQSQSQSHSHNSAHSYSHYSSNSGHTVSPRKTHKTKDSPKFHYPAPATTHVHTHGSTVTGLPKSVRFLTTTAAKVKSPRKMAKKTVETNPAAAVARNVQHKHAVNRMNMDIIQQHKNKRKKKKLKKTNTTNAAAVSNARHVVEFGVAISPRKIVVRQPSAPTTAADRMSPQRKHARGSSPWQQRIEKAGWLELAESAKNPLVKKWTKYWAVVWSDELLLYSRKKRKLATGKQQQRNETSSKIGTKPDIVDNIDPMPLHCIRLRQLSVPIHTNEESTRDKFEFTLHEKGTDKSHLLRTASEFERSLWIPCIESKAMGLCEDDDDDDELGLVAEKTISGYQAGRPRPMLKSDKTASCLVM